MTGMTLRHAAIVAVGTELVTGLRQETLGAAMALELSAVGIETRLRIVVPDDPGAIAEAVTRALRRAELVVVSGGLGPSDDDVTRQAVARALDRPLEEQPAIAAAIEARFAARGLAMPAINRRQAMVVAGAAVIANPHGTAPGQWIEVGDRVVLLLPGPPRELLPMLADLAPLRLAPRAPGARLERRTLCIAGLGESHVEQVMQPLYARWSRQPVPVAVTTLAGPGRVELHLSTRDEPGDRGPRALDLAAAEAAAVLGRHVYSRGEPLEEVVGARLLDRGWRLAVAESCTGGLLAARLTEVSGSSAWVEAGIVSYSNAAKVELVGVDPRLIEEHGAVSEPVALALVQGIRARTGAEVGVTITGIAGPTGGTPTKPVGTVVIALGAPEQPAEARTLRFTGSRQHVREQAVSAALDWIRRCAEDKG